MATCKQCMYVQQNRLGICRLAITSFVFRQFRASCTCTESRFRNPANFC